ncbi:hypothetical protein MKW92_033720 [Papaver armeniacum]|nr:hypothetical protein MKW92_033720 [Papaver armeniacum]
MILTFLLFSCLSKALTEDDLVYPGIQLSSRNLIKMAKSLLITSKWYIDALLCFTLKGWEQIATRKLWRLFKRTNTEPMGNCLGPGRFQIY